MNFYKIHWYINNQYKYKIYNDKNILIKAILSSFGGIASAINLIISYGHVFIDIYKNNQFHKRIYLNIKYIMFTDQNEKILIKIKKNYCHIKKNNKIIYDSNKLDDLNILKDILLLSYDNGTMKLKTKIPTLKNNKIIKSSNPDIKIDSQKNINRNLLFYNILIQPNF